MPNPAIACIFLLCATLASARNATSPARESKLIARVKNVPVSKLDPVLPSVRFEQWLRTEAGADAHFDWEVNDCGEQTGAPGQNPDEIPTCVEADARLKDGREIVITIAVQESSNRKTAVEKQSLTVHFAQLVTTHETINIRLLSDFPAALIKTHELVSYPEIAK